MLETRPILQKSLIGFGAFSFVFLAAMSGTAFMISGGFDLNPPERAQHLAAGDYVNLVQDQWSDWAAPEAASTYAPASYTPPQPAPQTEVATTEVITEGNLAGSGEVTAPIRDRTEQDVARDIDAEYAAMQEVERERAAANDEAVAASEDDYAKDGQY